MLDDDPHEVGPDEVSWREKGVGNWARDCGLLMTRENGLYNLWSPNPQSRVLDKVPLTEVEGYLGTL